MKVRKRTTKDRRVSCWSGGEIRKLLLFPDSVSYAGWDFLWRVSSTTVELAESDFTPLPDHRCFPTPLNGALRLSQNGGASWVFGTLEAPEFDGRVETKSRGEVTDSNLTLRKGEATGGMTVAVLRAGESRRLADLFSAEATESDALPLYCYAGAVALRHVEKEWVAEVGVYLLLSPEEREAAGLPFADIELLAVAEHMILAFAWMRQH